jgi:hypothetical protein
MPVLSFGGEAGGLDNHRHHNGVYGNSAETDDATQDELPQQTRFLWRNGRSQIKHGCDDKIKGQY